MVIYPLDKVIRPLNNRAQTAKGCGFIALQAESMIHNIRSVFLSNLETQDWMDDATKQAAREKVGGFGFGFGFLPKAEAYSP